MCSQENLATNHFWDVSLKSWQPSFGIASLESSQESWSPITELQEGYPSWKSLSCCSRTAPGNVPTIFSLTQIHKQQQSKSSSCASSVSWCCFWSGWQRDQIKKCQWIVNLNTSWDITPSFAFVVASLDAFRVKSCNVDMLTCWISFVTISLKTKPLRDPKITFKLGIVLQLWR